MPFESLTQRYEFVIHDFPEEWCSLIYLYDPDLPLFPLTYFHITDPQLPPGERPGERDRAFGFIHHVNFLGGSLHVTIATNKDLSDPRNSRYRIHVEAEARERLGIQNPISLPQIRGELVGQLQAANRLIEELWHHTIDRSFGKLLPFGRLWDPVLGLARFVASWYSDGGRKGELIQTHYFVSAFGERVATGSGIHVDFYLLPTFSELTSLANNLAIFPRYAALANAAEQFHAKFCSLRAVGSHHFSVFELKSRAKTAGSLNTPKLLSLFDQFAPREREAMLENYTAFNRGPIRSIISLLMLHDLRHSHWQPSALSALDCAAVYKSLTATYQSPKVVQLYSQLCFGSETALPIDTWVETFLRWPIGFRPARGRFYDDLFGASQVWGKIERLIWMCVQARKVHSSICAEILWCIRYGGTKKEMRGANPLACKICAIHIREVCPAHASILDQEVAFNKPTATSTFVVMSSDGSNLRAGQKLISCEAKDVYDEFSVRDRPDQFAPYPTGEHRGEPLKVSDFIAKY